MAKNRKAVNDEDIILKQQKELAAVVSSKEAINNSRNLSDMLAMRDAVYGIQYTHNGTRDMYKILGYPSTLTITDYKERYSRQDIAARIVEAYPNACWDKNPMVQDDEETQTKTAFETMFSELITNDRVRLMENLLNLDILAGLGKFAVMYIGIKDGKKADKPLVGKFTIDDILFMTCYDEEFVTVSEYVTNTQDSRYGMPLYYDIKTYVPNTVGTALNGNMRVHYSRIIHVADNTAGNKLMGVSRLANVYNRLIDLEKVVGGSAETFFLNARGGLHFNIDAEASFINEDSLQNSIQGFTNSLSRHLKTQGVEVKTLEFNIADPKNNAETIVSLIAAAKGMPRRILTGSEEGKLASLQDDGNWIKRVKERQGKYCEYSMLRPTISWFIFAGILPEPKQGKYTVIWEDLENLTKMDKAERGLKLTTAIGTYLSTGGYRVLPPKQLVEDVLGLEYREGDLDKGGDLSDLAKKEEAKQ